MARLVSAYHALNVRSRDARGRQGISVADSEKRGCSDLIPLTVPEVRHLLTRLVITVINLLHANDTCILNGDDTTKPSHDIAIIKGKKDGSERKCNCSTRAC